MKKLLTALFLVLALSMQAQVKFIGGVRGGANFAQLTETDLGTKTDYYVGGFAGVKFTSKYTLQPEVMYSRQGAKGDYQAYDPIYDNNGNLISEYRNVSADISLQYVSVGIMNKFTFVDRLSIVVGPSVEVLVDHNVPVETEADLALQLGLGVRIVNGLEAEFRVKKGIANVVDNEFFVDDDELIGIQDGTNLVFQVGLSYTFGR